MRKRKTKIGLVPSDYHFEWKDLFMPHGGLQRTLEEKQAKEADAQEAAQAAQDAAIAQSAARLAEAQAYKPPPDPKLAKKLSSAQKKLADLERKYATYKAQQAQQMPEGNDIMGYMDYTDLIIGALAEAVDEGIPLEEAEDIILEQFQIQITDQPMDPERQRGSVHRGAAYLEDVTYPPHGSSAGREGGWFSPQETVEIFGALSSVTDRQVSATWLIRNLGLFIQSIDSIAYTVAAYKRDGLIDALSAEEIVEALANLKNQALQLLKIAHRGQALQSEARTLPELSKRASLIANHVLGFSVKKNKDISVFGNSYSHGLDALGGGIVSRSLSKSPRAGYVVTKSASGSKVPMLVVNKPKHGDVKSSLQNARDVGQRAVSLGNRLLAALRAHPPKSVKPKAAAKPATKVHGVPAPKRRPVKLLSPSQIKKVADSAVKAGHALLDKAKNLQSLVNKQAAKKAAGTESILNKMFSKKLVTTLAKPTSAASKAGAKLAPAKAPMSQAAARAASLRKVTTALHGDDLDYAASVLGVECDILLGELCGYTGPIDDSGAADDSSSYDSSADAYAPDATTDSSAAMPDDYQYVDPSWSEANNYGMPPVPTEAPTRDPSEYTAGKDVANDMHVYDLSADPSVKAPVYYDGSHGLPYDKMGSWNRYYGPYANAPDGGIGYFWGSRPGNDAGWVFRNKDNEAKGDHSDNEHQPADKVLSVTANSSEVASRLGTANLGPLVGAPGDWTANLRFDMGSKQWFWFYDQAPKWSRADEEARRLAQAVTDWQTERTNRAALVAAKTLADQWDKEQADAQLKQQTKTDAADQHRRDQEYAESEQEAKVQALADEAAARQAQQDAEIERQAALTDAEIERQAMEEEAAIEQRAIETAARLEAMAPPDYSESAADQGVADEDAADYEVEEEPFIDEGGLPSYSMDEGPVPVLEEEDTTLMGMLHGMAKVRARGKNRRGE